ncbi:hypothetical protein ACLEJQ_17015 [Pseudomonas sp. SMV71]|uniref:DUF7683 domain-containing protein n=1 Tax=Pseudomonas sp. SMV71 TaxID=3390195 RepID=UPI003F87F95C
MIIGIFGEHEFKFVQSSDITYRTNQAHIKSERQAMLYTVEAFYNTTGLLAFEERLPEGYDEVLRVIMGWAAEQQGWEGYDLSRYQLEILETILGKSIHDPAYFSNQL